MNQWFKKAGVLLVVLMLVLSLAACGKTADTTEKEETATTTTAATDEAADNIVKTQDDADMLVSEFTGIERDKDKGCFYNEDNLPDLTADGLSGTLREAYYTTDGSIIAVFMVGNGSDMTHQISAFDARIFNAAGETVAEEYLSGSTVQVDADNYSQVNVMISADHVKKTDDPLSELGVELTFESVTVNTDNVGTVTSVTATHYAAITIKDYGTITVALDAKTAPITVENFKALADSGFYDGLTFHRIMEGFMMQGGDPNGNGTGGSDKEIKGEFAYNGHENPLSHVRGAISMARSSAYDSGSSQFFIVHKDSTFLDGQYAAFGYVTEGMDIVDAICTAAEPTDNNGSIAPDAQPVIETIVVTEA